MKSKMKNYPQLKAALFGAALVCATGTVLAQGVEDYVVDQFASGIGSWAYNYGSATNTTVEWDGTENRNASDGTGAMKVTIDFDLCTGNVQSDFEGLLADTLDLTKYTKLHFSVKVDPSSSRLSDWGGGAFGNMRPHIRKSDWSGDSNIKSPGEQWVGADAYGAWVDYTLDIDQTLDNLATRQAAGILGFDIWSGWGDCATPIGHTNTVILWVDNIWFEWNTNTAPPPPPTLALNKAGPSGVTITMNEAGNQWQRDAIASPENPGNCFWSGYGATPVTYSFTVADFPDPIEHEGFEAHLYIVNRDTSSAFDETYGGCDWNAADIAIVSLQALTNGTYECTFMWKTNLPAANPPEDEIHRPAILASPTVLGTWSVSFTDNTNVTLSGPGGISTNFAIPEAAVLNNFSPAASFIQFGIFKNDDENDGHNDGVSGTFSRVQKTGGDFVFDDSFDGPTLTNNYAWRRTSASAVQHYAPGTDWIVSWTVPAIGFTPQSAPAVTGPWGSAGAAGTFQSGGMMHAPIPTSALPSGESTYFRLVKREVTRLQILLPGESAAPGTATGKTGTPDTQTALESFFVTVRAVDDNWNLVPGISHTVSFQGSDGGADLVVPVDGNLANGEGQFEAYSFAPGNFTITVTNVTEPSILSDTSSEFTVN